MKLKLSLRKLLWKKIGIKYKKKENLNKWRPELDELLGTENSDKSILDFAKERAPLWKNVKRVIIKEVADDEEASRRFLVKNELLNVSKN